MALDLDLDLDTTPGSNAPDAYGAGRMAWIEMDDPTPAPAPTAPPAPTPTVIVHDRELNGARFADARAQVAAGGESHGLTSRASGQVRRSADLLASSDLDWDPVAVPLVADVADAGPADLRRVPRAQLVLRSDTRDPIATVGARYQPIGHRRLFQLADAIVGDSGGLLRYGNAGHVGNGARPFLQLACETGSPAGDVTRTISLFTSHDGSTCASVGFASTVIVCRNTYTRASREARHGLRIRHTASADQQIAQVEAIARASAEYVGAWDNAALRMLGQRFGDADMAALAHALIPGESAKADAARDRLLSAWESAPGARPGTVWGAAQAVTYYTSHLVGRPESRAEAAIFGTGTSADLESRAWWILDAPEEERAAALAQHVYVRTA